MGSPVSQNNDFFLLFRYVLLSYCMAMRTVSFRVKKRFPDLQHLVDAGLMRPDELKVRKSNFEKKNSVHSV